MSTSVPDRVDSPDRNETKDGIERLASLLEFEIEQARSRRAEAGWTRWALLGSCATLLWLITSQLETPPYDSTHIVLVILTCSILLDFLKMIGTTLTALETPSGQQLNLTTGRTMLSNSRSLLLFDISRSFLLACLGVVMMKSVPALLGWLATILYGIDGLLFVGGLILSFSSFYVSRRPSKTSKDWKQTASGLVMKWLRTILSAVASIVYILALLHSHSSGKYDGVASRFTADCSGLADQATDFREFKKPTSQQPNGDQAFAWPRDH